MAPDRLRFDFTHQKGMSPDEIATVEREVNGYIRQNGEVTTRLMTPDEAQKMGARALFGEKYGDEVRVVSMGARPDGQQGTRRRHLFAGALRRHTCRPDRRDRADGGHGRGARPRRASAASKP